MDIAFSKFRNHTDPSFYDGRILVLNSGKTDRKKIAHTLDYLNRVDAKAIGLDILLDSFYQLPEDSLLQKSLMGAKQTVLGFTFNEGRYHEDSKIGFYPHPFFDQGNRVGYVNIATNDGFSVRAFEPFHKVEGVDRNAFAVELADLFNPELTSQIRARKSQLEWINFKRVQPGAVNMQYPINSSQVIHYDLIEMDQFLSDTAQYEKEQLANKIVLIGFCGEDENAYSMKDRHYTPLNEQYTGRSHPDMYGVIVHANIISMILDGDYIRDIPESTIYYLAIMLFLFNFFLFKTLHHFNFFRSLPYIRFLQVIEFFIILATCIFLLINLNIKLGFTFLATCVILSFEFYEIYELKLKAKVQVFLDEIGLWTRRNRLISKS